MSSSVHANDDAASVISGASVREDEGTSFRVKNSAQHQSGNPLQAVSFKFEMFTFTLAYKLSKLNISSRFYGASTIILEFLRKFILRYLFVLMYECACIPTFYYV